MKIGIYFRELISIGGGNRHTLAIAAHLSRRHDVEIITHTPLGAAQTLHRFDLDLDAVSLRLVPAQPDHALGWLTAEYDLFINRFHSMFIPNQARLGILFVLFPVPIAPDPLGRVRRMVAQALYSRLIRYTFSAGIFGEEHLDGRRVWLLARQARIDLKPAGRAYGVSFRLHNPTPGPKQVGIRLDGVRVDTVTVGPGAVSSQCRVEIPAGLDRTGHRLSLETAGPGPVDRVPVTALPADGFAHLFLADFETTHPSFRLYTQLFERRLPAWRHRLLNIPPSQAQERIAGYQRVWANSEFTRSWIRRYWQRESTVIYPAIPVESVPLKAKQPWILSVGRFFTSAHNKKHLIMVEAFKEMCRQGLSGWELHLAGEVIDNPTHRRYFQQIQEAAQGYPIRLHANLSMAELKRLYGESAIYWHAAGYGEDEESQPIKHEHFGITTVEAMAAGCVPVVIGKGGQPEIIAHGENGFLWQTIPELQQYTDQLIQNKALLRHMAAAAHTRSSHFDQAHFEAQIDAALAELGMGMGE